MGNTYRGISAEYLRQAELNLLKFADVENDGHLKI